MNDSTYINVGDGGPEGVIELALRVQSAGQDFAQRAQALQQAIKDAENTHPEGEDDRFADAFRSNYRATPEGADQPANEAVAGSMVASAEALTRIGSTGVEAMGKYLVTDADSGADIGSTEQSA
jgi:hypothetical protein